MCFKYFKKEDPILTYEYQLKNETEPLSFTNKTLPMFFAINDINGNFISNEEYFYITFRYALSNFYDPEETEPFKETYLIPYKCTEEDKALVLSNQPTVINMIDYTYCVDVSGFELFGNYNAFYYSYFSILVNYCKAGNKHRVTGEDCPDYDKEKQQEILHGLSSFGVLYPTYFVDKNNILDPFSFYFKFKTIDLKLSTYQSFTYSIEMSHMETTNYALLSSTKSLNHEKAMVSELLVTDDFSESKDSILAVNYYLSYQYRQYAREYVSLEEFLGNIGGIFQLLMLIINLVVSLYSENCFYLNMYELLNKFKLESSIKGINNEFKPKVIVMKSTDNLEIKKKTISGNTNNLYIQTHTINNDMIDNNIKHINLDDIDKNNYCNSNFHGNGIGNSHSSNSNNNSNIISNNNSKQLMRVLSYDIHNSNRINLVEDKKNDMNIRDNMSSKKELNTLNDSKDSKQNDITKVKQYNDEDINFNDIKMTSLKESQLSEINVNMNKKINTINYFPHENSFIFNSPNQLITENLNIRECIDINENDINKNNHNNNKLNNYYKSSSKTTKRVSTNSLPIDSFEDENNTSNRDNECILKNEINMKLSKIQFRCKRNSSLEEKKQNNNNNSNGSKQGKKSLMTELHNRDSEVMFIKVLFFYFLDFMSCRKGNRHRRLVKEYERMKDDVEDKLNISTYYNLLIKQELLKALLLDNDQINSLNNIF